MKETFYLTMLVVPRQAAKAVIRKQIEFAMQLRRLPTKLVSDRDVANYRAEAWCNLVKVFLCQIATDGSLAGRLPSWEPVTYDGGMESPLKAIFLALEGVLAELDVINEKPTGTCDRRPTLLALRGPTTAALQREIVVGGHLCHSPVYEAVDREATNLKVAEWCDSVQAILARLASDGSLRSLFPPWQDVRYGDTVTAEALGEVLKDRLKLRCEALKWIISILSVFEQRGTEMTGREAVVPGEIAEDGVTAMTKQEPVAPGDKVFIVHGHDHGTKEMVARFVEKMGLEAIVLHEQLSRNMTIIEKVERYSDVAFAVVLLTPDDMGYPKSSPDKAKGRARQNVVLELGYFTGRLGRGRVCCLVGEGVEIPSDYTGVVYTGIDSGGAWRLTLAREMGAAGLPIDLNRV